jgi:hypothetical protein
VYLELLKRHGGNVMDGDREEEQEARDGRLDFIHLNCTRWQTHEVEDISFDCKLAGLGTALLG